MMRRIGNYKSNFWDSKCQKKGANFYFVDMVVVSNFWPWKKATAQKKRGLFSNNSFLVIKDLKAPLIILWVPFRNEELPRDFRLKENSFQMTTFIFDDIAAKTEERLNLVRMDTDKATEESKEALEKVRRRFFDDILFPKLIVKAIRYLISQRFTIAIKSLTTPFLIISVLFRSKYELSSYRIGRHNHINLDIRIASDETHEILSTVTSTDIFKSTQEG